MKKSCFNKSCMALLTLAALLVSLFSFAAPVSANTLSTSATSASVYEQDFTAYAETDSINYTFTPQAADNGAAATVENFTGTDNTALKIVSTTTHTSGRDVLKISMPGMPEEVNQIEVYFNFRVEGTGRRGFVFFASTQDNDNHLRGASASSVGMYRSGWTNTESLDVRAVDQWFKVRQVYNLEDNTFSVYYGDNYENTWVSNDTANKTEAWVNSLTGETINLWFGTNMANSWGSGDSFTYWLDDVKIVGKTTGLKEYAQDFGSYGDYDYITYNYTPETADGVAAAAVENYTGTEDKALKVVSTATSNGTGDVLKISMPGMPEEVNQIEVYFSFRVDYTNGAIPFYVFASTQNNTNHLRSSSAQSVGLHRGSWTNSENLGALAADQWFKVRQVYNLEDNTFSVYYGDHYENIWVLNDTGNKTDAWVDSLTGETVNLYFRNNQWTWTAAAGASTTYWLDDIKIVGTAMPVESLYDAAGTNLYTEAINGGDSVTVKIENMEHTGLIFVALKNSVTGELAAIQSCSSTEFADGNGVVLTAPEGDETATYIAEVYHFDSLSTIKPLFTKATLGNVAS